MNRQNVKFIKSTYLESGNTTETSSIDDLRSHNQRQARVEIDLAALRDNISLLKSKAGTGAELMAVVKANAYGHGAVEVSRVAAEEKVGYLGVALLEEADEIRNAGIEIPIVMLYPENLSRSLEATKKGYIITVSDIGILNRIGEVSKDDNIPVRYFLKINTGMNRYGIKVENINDILDMVETGNGYDFMGFMTNLADSNGVYTELSQKQENEFSRLMKSARERFGENVYLSFESSGYFTKIDHAAGNLARIGHLLYGSLGGDTGGFKPVMSVKSRIAEIQSLEKGEGVGYGFSFIAEKDMKIAIIPMGYADGYPWSLSNRGFVLIKGEIARVVGRICMDAFMVDITDIKDCSAEDEVVVMGSMGDRTITPQLLGELAGSFSYEIMSRWSDRLPRKYK